MPLGRLTHTGATLRSQSATAKAEVMAVLQEKVWPLISNGQLKPILYQSFDLENARQAHELLPQGKYIGKLVLRLCCIKPLEGKVFLIC